MFILFGWLRQPTDQWTKTMYCDECQAPTPTVGARIARSITIQGVPVLPLRSEWMVQCGVCSSSWTMPKGEWLEMASGAIDVERVEREARIAEVNRRSSLPPDLIGWIEHFESEKWLLLDNSDTSAQFWEETGGDRVHRLSITVGGDGSLTNRRKWKEKVQA